VQKVYENKQKNSFSVASYHNCSLSVTCWCIHNFHT